MDIQPRHTNILEERKALKASAIKKLRILIFIGIGMLCLFLVIIFAAIKQGGFSNLTKGNKNVVLNTLENVGTTFTGEKDSNGVDPNTYNKPVKVTFAPKPKDEVTLSQEQNEIVFDPYSSQYYIKVKKDSYIKFINNTGGNLNISISGLDQVALKDTEIRNIKAARVGKFQMKDLLDKSPMQINGTIEVVE